MFVFLSYFGTCSNRHALAAARSAASGAQSARRETARQFLREEEEKNEENKFEKMKKWEATEGSKSQRGGQAEFACTFAHGHSLRGTRLSCDGFGAEGLILHTAKAPPPPSAHGGPAEQGTPTCGRGSAWLRYQSGPNTGTESAGPCPPPPPPDHRRLHHGPPSLSHLIPPQPIGSLGASRTGPLPASRWVPKPFVASTTVKTGAPRLSILFFFSLRIFFFSFTKNKYLLTFWK